MRTCLRCGELFTPKTSRATMFCYRQECVTARARDRKRAERVRRPPLPGAQARPRLPRPRCEECRRAVPPFRRRWCSDRCRNRADGRVGAQSSGRVLLGRSGSALERFMCKVREQPSGCWLWIASKNGHGYGLFGDGGTKKAHRWSYEHHVGPIPDGMEIDHLCGVRACVNPAHLEAVTPSENHRRAVERQRTA